MRVSDYEVLYDLPAGECDGRGFEGVRTVTIRAGKSLEVMVHPNVPLTGEARREAKIRRTSRAMEIINARNRERHMMRLIDNNFTVRALVVTLTYAYPTEDYQMCNLRELSDTYYDRGLPWDMGEVKRDVRNFIARLKRRVKRASADVDALKWLLKIEEGKEPPAEGLPPKYHIHAIIEAEGLTREMIEGAWIGGPDRANSRGLTRCERLRLRDDGAARLANYLCKQKWTGWCFSHSRNLKVPEPRISDRKISRRRLSMIAADVMKNGRGIFEALYPGYRVVELPDVRYSDFVAGAYIYARMRRRD